MYVVPLIFSIVNMGGTWDGTKGGIRSGTGDNNSINSILHVVSKVSLSSL